MIFFRIQPAGLDLAHLSEDSSGDLSCLHVFKSAHELFQTDVKPSVYGDEVVVISAPDCFDHGDVEGVGINPDDATIVARFEFVDFARRFFGVWLATVEADLERPARQNDLWGRRGLNGECASDYSPDFSGLL